MFQRFLNKFGPQLIMCLSVCILVNLLRLKSASAKEPLTQISVENRFPLYFLHKTSNIYNEQKWCLFGLIHLFYFLGNFFIATSNSTENRKLKHKILGSLKSRLKITHSVKRLNSFRTTRLLFPLSK